MLQVKQVGQKTILSEQGILGTGAEKAHKLWKEGLATQGDYRAAVYDCRKKMRKAKAQLELTLGTLGSDDKKAFFNVNSRKRSMENIALILGEDGRLTSKEEENAEAFVPFLSQHLTVKTDLGLPVPQS